MDANALNTAPLGVALNGLCALGGGLLIPLHYLIQKLRNGQPLPALRSRAFWLPFILYPLPGVVVCLVYQIGKIDLSPVVCLNLGLTGPALIASRIDSEPARKAAADPAAKPGV